MAAWLAAGVARGPERREQLLALFEQVSRAGGIQHAIRASQQPAGGVVSGVQWIARLPVELNHRLGGAGLSPKTKSAPYQVWNAADDAKGKQGGDSVSGHGWASIKWGAGPWQVMAGLLRRGRRLVSFFDHQIEIGVRRFLVAIGYESRGYDAKSFLVNLVDVFHAADDFTVIGLGFLWGARVERVDAAAHPSSHRLPGRKCRAGSNKCTQNATNIKRFFTHS